MENATLTQLSSPSTYLIGLNLNFIKFFIGLALDSNHNLFASKCENYGDGIIYVFE